MYEKVKSATELFGNNQFDEGEALLRECIADPLPEDEELNRVVPLVILGDLFVEFKRMDEAKVFLEQAVSHAEKYKDTPLQDVEKNNAVQRAVKHANFLLTKFYA